MATFQYIHSILLILLCLSGATNVSLISSQPSSWIHSCVTWYHQTTCWGEGDDGRLGLGSNTTYPLPPSHAVSLNADFIPIATIGGYKHSCALSDDGRVACWGLNTFGTLGIGNTETVGDQTEEMGDYLESVDLGTGFIAAQLVSALYHNCALSTNHDVKCWVSCL